MFFHFLLSEYLLIFHCRGLFFYKSPLLLRFNLWENVSFKDATLIRIQLKQITWLNCINNPSGLCAFRGGKPRVRLSRKYVERRERGSG